MLIVQLRKDNQGKIMKKPMKEIALSGHIAVPPAAE
jgi:hypothetical protein